MRLRRKTSGQAISTAPPSYCLFSHMLENQCSWIVLDWIFAFGGLTIRLGRGIGGCRNGMAGGGTVGKNSGAGIEIYARMLSECRGVEIHQHQEKVIASLVA